jgi:hypothetical protein
MQSTSLEAYYEKVLPQLAKQQLEVLEVFMRHPSLNFTDRELARLLHWEERINCVNGRRNELVTQGYLVGDCKRTCLVTHNRAIAWKLVELKRRVSS